MAASINDKLRKTRSSDRPVAAYLTATKTIGASGASINVATGWPTDTAIDFIIFRKDTSGNTVQGTVTTWVGTLSGTSISNLTLKAGTDMEYTQGEQSVVLMVPTAAWSTDLITALLNSLDQSGNISATNTATFNSNIDINDASTAIRDSSANELLKFVKTSSAVNEVTITNAATGNAPQIAASGGDTNADLKVKGKGTGRAEVNGAGAGATATVATSETTTSTTYTDLATTTDTVTVNVGSSGQALVSIATEAGNSGADGTTSISFAVSGATTIAATTARHQVSQRLTTATARVRYSHTVLVDGLTAGSNTFKMKYSVPAGTGTFLNRTISVVPIP